MDVFRRRFTPAGAPPGAVAPTDDGVPPILEVLVYDGQELDEHKPTSPTAPELDPQPGHVTWIDVRGFGDGTLIQELGERVGMHPLAVSDVLNVGQRPKIEPYDGESLFIVLRSSAVDAEGELLSEQVSLFLTGDRVLTFQEHHADTLLPLRERLRAARRRIRNGTSDYLACMVIDAIVDAYFPVVEHYGDRLEDLEERVLEGADSDELAPLYAVRRDLTALRRAVWPLRDALTQLMRDEDSGVDESCHVYLRDAQDHVMQIVDLLESYRELAAGLVELHLSLVGQKTNDVMRTLTVVATIFIPLTFVAGVYGMNFETGSPWNLPELGWRYGYPMFWAVCLVLAGVLLLLFRRLGWLGGKPDA